MQVIELVNQILNPVEYHPRGGRVVEAEDDEPLRGRRKPKTPKPRDPEVSEKYRRMLEARRNGKSYSEIALAMGVTPQLARLGVLEHARRQESV